MGSAVTRLMGTFAVLLAGCDRAPPAPPAPQAVPVKVLTVQPRTVPAVFEFLGQTESSQQVEIRSRVDGFLEKRVYREGSVVKPGDVLFRIDRKPFDASLAAARAELTQQQARLTTARANLGRVKPLAAQNALAQKDLDEATGQEQAAAAAVEAARAKVDQAQLNVGYATVTSPVAGLTSFAKVQDGAYLDATNSLLTYVARLDPMRVNFTLSENEVLRRRDEMNRGVLKPPPGDQHPVEVLLADGSMYAHRGRITFADAAFSQETGTFLIRAELPNPKSELRPGQFVRVKVLGFQRPGAMVVPQRAVQQGPRGSYVWVADAESKARQVNVGVGDWLGDDWVVDTGLKAGDRVVVDGAQKLAPGAPLQVSAAPPPAAASAAAASAASAPAPGVAAVPATPSILGAGPDPGERAVYFTTGSAAVDATGGELLRRLARSVGNGTLVVSGHADASGDAAANLRLAKARAESVARVLQAAGVPRERIALRKPDTVIGGEEGASRRVDVAVEATP